MKAKILQVAWQQKERMIFQKELINRDAMPAAKEALHTSLMGEVNRRYNASEYEFSEPTYAIDYLQVEKKYGTSLVALCWVNYIFPQTEIGGDISTEE